MDNWDVVNAAISRGFVPPDNVEDLEAARYRSLNDSGKLQVRRFLALAAENVEFLEDVLHIVENQPRSITALATANPEVVSSLITRMPDEVARVLATAAAEHRSQFEAAASRHGWSNIETPLEALWPAVAPLLNDDSWEKLAAAAGFSLSSTVLKALNRAGAAEGDVQLALEDIIDDWGAADSRRVATLLSSSVGLWIAIRQWVDTDRWSELPQRRALESQIAQTAGADANLWVHILPWLLRRGN